jgi:peroxiredoxin
MGTTARPRALPFAFPSALAAFLLAVLLASPSNAAKRTARPPPPEVVTGKDAAGLVARLGAGKPLVLHFFATWCGACKAELPRLRKHLIAYVRRGVTVVLVSVDGPESRAKVPAFLKGVGLQSLRTLVLDADPALVAGGLGEAAWDGGLPATFVYDSKGVKVQALLGATDAGLLDAAVEAAER